MVKTQIQSRGIADPDVLRAFLEVDRALFTPEEFKHHSYKDYPLGIGRNQTISQPYMVALMTELLDVREDHRVLEIGSGSGYQTAILSRLAKEVYSLERIESLSALAAENLAKTGVHNVKFRVGDGFDGWPEEAPFDRIMVTASPQKMPKKLIEQLKPDGRMILPIGEPSRTQTLYLVKKIDDDFTLENHGYVAFVPMLKGVES